MRIDAPIITGSFSLNGSTLGSLTSVATTGSNTFLGGQSATSFAGDQLTANDRAYLRRIDGIAGTTIEVIAPISASAGITGSTNFDTIVNKPTLVSGSSQVIDILSSLNSATASFTPRISNLESKSASVDISITNINSYTSSQDTKNTTLGSYTGSNDTKWTSIGNLTGSYATTGSNTFFGTQTYSGSVYIANDLIVQGSSSIQYISASSVSIGTNIVQLNTANPSVRFAGLTIIDSGSIGGSGSFLYDSVHDEFVFVHRGNGTNVTSSHFVLGPETYDSLGNETYLTSNIIPKGTGKEHLIDSCIFDNGTTTCIKNNLIGTTAYFNSSITASNALLRSADSAAVVDIFTLYNPSSTSSGVRQKYQNGFGDLAAIKVSQRDNGALADDGQIEFQVASNSVLDTKLTILNTGEATFCSSVTAGDDITISKTTSNLRLFLNNTTTTTGRSWYFNSYSNGSLYAGNTTAGDIFNFSSTGAATFSGNVNVYDGSSHGLSISNSSGAITFSNNWGKTTFTAPSAQDIEFNDDAGIRRLFLKNGGNVGIGTCTAAAKLEIEAGRNCTLLRLTATTGENWDIKNTNTVGSTDVLSIGAAGATANLNLKDDGSVGIGTCTPSGLFQVGVANSGIYFDTSLQYTPKIIAAGTISDIQIQSVGNGGNVYLNAPGTTSLIGMSVNGSERMRITNGGNVLIGTTCIYNTANFIVSAGSSPTSSPYMGIFNCTTSPTNDASTRLDLGFLGGASNYVATGGCLGFINFMGQGNDAGYGGASIITVTTCGGNTCRFNHATDMVFTAKPTGQTGALERMRITSGGTIFNKQWFGASLMGGYSLIGTIGPGNVGNRYLHARINTIGSMMVWIKIFGYSYVGGILEGIGGGYVDGGTGTIAQNYNNGSIPIIYQNGGYIEVVVDTIQTGTTNRWGSITFLGGTDTIATVQALEIMTWSWTSTTSRVY